MTNGKSNPNADELQKGTWAFHQKVYGADFPYQNFAPQFKAELFDPDHWADVFANSGAKYIVLTSKHHEGFALWLAKKHPQPGDARGTQWRLARNAICSAISPRLFVGRDRMLGGLVER